MVALREDEFQKKEMSALCLLLLKRVLEAIKGSEQQ